MERCFHLKKVMDSCNPLDQNNLPKDIYHTPNYSRWFQFVLELSSLPTKWIIIWKYGGGKLFINLQISNRRTDVKWIENASFSSSRLQQTKRCTREICTVGNAPGGIERLMNRRPHSTSSGCRTIFTCSC